MVILSMELIINIKKEKQVKKEMTGSINLSLIEKLKQNKRDVERKAKMSWGKLDKHMTRYFEGAIAGLEIAIVALEDDAEDEYERQCRIKEYQDSLGRF